MRLFPTLSAPIRTARVAVAAVALLAAANVVEAQTATASPTSEPAPASSPIAQPRAQVPGYYRMALGDDVVTALYDGYIDLPAKTLLGLSAQSIQGLLARMFVSSTSGMQTAVNGYLIDTGSQRILVDTGSGTCFGPTMGGLAGNLRAAGGLSARADRRGAADAPASRPRLWTADAAGPAGVSQRAGLCGGARGGLLAE